MVIMTTITHLYMYVVRRPAVYDHGSIRVYDNIIVIRLKRQRHLDTPW